jgi:hypothetical protein
MDDATLNSHLVGLLASKAALEGSIEDSTGDTTGLEAQLVEVEQDLELACADARADCPTDANAGSSVADSQELPMQMIALVGIAVIIMALLGLLLTRRQQDDLESDWTAKQLPVHDTVANSMYGGAQQIFQAPAPVIQQAPAAVIPQAPAGGPQLPASGLPAGWTMEQWVYYGQQYLDDQR